MARELSEHLTPQQYNREVLLGVPQDTKPSRAKRDDTEAVFQSRVIRIAEAAGYSVYHTHNSERSNPGMPDLLMFREDVGVVHLWELKRRGGHPSAEQCHFLQHLDGKVIDCRLFGPDDLPLIERILR